MPFGETVRGPFWDLEPAAVGWLEDIRYLECFEVAAGTEMQRVFSLERGGGALLCFER